MDIVKATWSPAFYGGDQSLAVGQKQRFAFFKQTPVYLRGYEGLIFYSGNIHPEWLHEIEVIIVAITHPILGGVKSVSNDDGFNYTITLTDGTRLSVDAEENPGKLIRVEGQWSDAYSQIEDWTMQVDLQKA